jgi:hypothetical protein
LQGDFAMETPKAFERVVAAGFDVLFVSHAAAILEVDFPGVLEELAAVLLAIRSPVEELIGSGGGETQGTQRLRRALAANNWTKLNFKIEKRVNDVPRESISHQVDHVKKVVSVDGLLRYLALEIEGTIKIHFLIAILRILSACILRLPFRLASS